MSLQLSFKRKIVFALGLSVVGFAAMGIVAFIALNGLGASVERVDALARTRQAADDTFAVVLSLSAASPFVTQDNAKSFRDKIAKQRGEAEGKLAAAEKMAHDPDVAKRLVGLRHLLAARTAALDAWAQKKAVVGFDDTAGLWGRCVEAARALEEGVKSRPVLYVQLLQARRHEKNFVARRTPDYVEKVRVATAQLRSALAKDPALALVDGYEKAFDAASQATLEVVAAERELGKNFAEVERTSTEISDQVGGAFAAASNSAKRARVSAMVTIFGGSTLMAGVLLSLVAWIGAQTLRNLSRTIGLLRQMGSGQGDLTQRLPLSYANCAEVKQCGHNECDCYGKATACWSHVGSMQLIKDKIQCPSVLSGKITDCSACDVFQSVERDEFDTLANWFNIFVDKIRYLIIGVSGATSELVAASTELSATTVQIASSNTEVSSQAQSVASASEEMSVTVADVARNGSAVNDAAEEARSAAVDGAAVVGEAVAALGELADVVGRAGITVTALGEKSEKIGVVVDVIEDIADQTNLLALNAAIEAARAGEHGRGFAVVADEVRKLAEKTVKATQEIGQTVAAIQAESRGAVAVMEGGQRTVAHGAALGKRAGETMRAVESQVTNATEQTQRIAVATEQLSATIRTLASNMDEIAMGVEQNTTAGEEIARTAESVANKAEELRTLTERFRT